MSGENRINYLKTLREKINNLEQYEHIEIFKIIRKNNIKYTENNNGVFINMNKMGEKCIEDIESFISFINNNLNKI
tara:strand:+ start:2060 stop:2287 length:228 start_codon:yes stop_codon:yes gene_type:complete